MQKGKAVTVGSHFLNTAPFDLTFHSRCLRLAEYRRSIIVLPMQNGKILSIQCLRAIAAALVALHHAQNQAAIYCANLDLPPALLNFLPTMQKFGASGIDIFFVISGFVMAYVTRRHRGNLDYAPIFLKKRLIRVVPIYWIWTTLFVIILIAAPHLFCNSVFELRGTIFSYLMLPYTPDGSYNSPVLPVGWTLWFEMYFYVLVACGLIFKECTFLAVLGIFFAVCVAFGSHLPFTGRFAWVMTNPLLFEFLAGFALGILFSKKMKVPAWVPGLALSGAIVLYALWIAQAAPIHIGVPSVLLVTGFTLLDKSYSIRYPKSLVALGDSSYSLYLTNFFVGPAVVKCLVIFNLISTVPPDVYIVFTTALCILVGHLAYIWVELPVIPQKKSTFQKHHFSGGITP